MNLNLEKKRALITGDSKGIGKAIRECLEKEGVITHGVSRSNGFDLTSVESMNQVIKMLQNYDFDILINNIGGGGIWEPRDFRIVMEKNYGITNELTRAFLSREKKWGRVITIASIYGTEPGHNPGFASAKAAQIMYMKSMAINPKYKGITFNCVSPREVSDAGTPKNVELKSVDVANLVTFLCSEKSNQINEQNIVIGI